MKAQRLRLRYRLTAEAAELRPREILQAWADAARAAGLDVSYSTGKRPAPQISLAAPLPQGVTSECELLDLYLDSHVDPADALARIAVRTPPGLEPVRVWEVGLGAPSVQSQIRWVEYEVDVPVNGVDEYKVRSTIDCLLSQTSINAEYRREGKSRVYDLRPLILRLQVVGHMGETLRLSMTLRAEQENSARADQVVLALRLPKASRIHRKRLGLAAVPPVIASYRRAGKPEED